MGMEVIQQPFSYRRYSDDRALENADAALLAEARRATALAYAPYSAFRVGAALRLADGGVVVAANQENASFPAGLCAERAVLAAAASCHPGVAPVALAISFDNTRGSSSHPISPCGICRQSLLESELRFKSPLKIIMGGLTGPVQVVDSAAALLPLSFSSGDLGR